MYYCVLLHFDDLTRASTITRITKKYRNSKIVMRLKPTNSPSKPPNDAERIDKNYYFLQEFYMNFMRTYIYLSYRINYANCN